jgi:hypothetical protein
MNDRYLLMLGKNKITNSEIIMIRRLLFDISATMQTNASESEESRIVLSRNAAFSTPRKLTFAVAAIKIA